MTKSSLQVGVNKLKKWWDDEAQVLRCTLPFQRHSGAWSAYTRSSLIWSMLADSYIPPIVLLKDKAGLDGRGRDAYVYEVLDGQQRLTNIFSFINDEWALHSATPLVSYDGFEYDVAGRKFTELEEELQNAVLQFRFILQCLENYTMDEAESLFFCINSGVALSAIQKAKPKMGTELIRFFSGLLCGSFFAQAVNITEAQAKREDDLLMLLQSVLLLDNRRESQDYKSISAANCSMYAEGIRGSYNADRQAEFAGVIRYLDKAFTVRNKFLSKNNVPIVVVMAQIALEQGVAGKDFAGFINMFSNSLYPSYKEASGSGNVKARLVQMRLRVMFLAMCRHFGLDVGRAGKPFADGIPLYDGLLLEDGLSPEEAEQAAGGGTSAPEGGTPPTDSVMEDVEGAAAESDRAVV